MTARVLLVEDDAGLAMVLADLLAGHGCEVTRAVDGDQGLHLASSTTFDLLILDVLLPGRDGYSVCDAVRRQGFDGGILMLTARAEVSDRVHGLQTGADDYLVKPFDSDELVARVHALLRRVHKEARTAVTRFSFGDIDIDVSRGEVTRNGQPLTFTHKELQLLRYFIDHRGQVLSRDRLLGAVWPQQPFISPRTVDVHVAWLRQKVEHTPAQPRHILTVRGEGYRFERE